MSDRVSNFIVQGTLGLLVLFSVVTWALVAAKALQVARARRQDKKLRTALGEWKALPSREVLTQYAGPTARVALAGATAWDSARHGASAEIEVAKEILELSFKRQIQKERRVTEAGLAVLASIGTTSPFVGLFGTVWGIMHALKSISSAGSASLDVVAGPIGEALIATGIGIAVAVPAVLAFNFFVRRQKVQTADLEDFATLFLAAALKGALGDSRSPRTSDEHSFAKLSESRPAGSLREARV
ncbi:MAG TPA: MotA/TolQ/ExbB proton channel family protein [Polyangiaceae bacterium]|nr:MotA/TolQ/ExbB proton channel family protein [Polyangiaceae bacterium]